MLRIRVPSIALLAPADTSTGEGTSAGTSTATGVGISTALATGTAAGAATATGAGSSTASAIGAAIGTSTANAVGQSVASTAGTSTGTSTATAVGLSTGASVGNATGTSTATAISEAIAEAVGASAGASTASAIGVSVFESAGSAAGTSTATADGFAIFEASGSASGTSTAIGVSGGVVLAVGTSAGVSAAVGVSFKVTDMFSELLREIRSHLSQQPGIQEYLGAQTASEAASKIFLYEYPLDVDGNIILLERGQNWVMSRERINSPAGRHFSKSGTVELYWKSPIYGESLEVAQSEAILSAIWKKVARIADAVDAAPRIDYTPAAIVFNQMELSEWWRPTADDVQSEGDSLSGIFTIEYSTGA